MFNTSGDLYCVISLLQMMDNVCHDLQTIQSVSQCLAVANGFHRRSRIPNIKENGQRQ